MSPASRRCLPFARRACLGFLAGLALVSLPAQAQHGKLAEPPGWQQTWRHGVAALDASEAL